MNSALSKLRVNADSYAQLSTSERIRLLDGLRRNTLEVADSMVQASCEAKGIAHPSPISGEEWLQIVFLPFETYDYSSSHYAALLDMAYLHFLE